jgi:hypothetical protein
MVVPFTPFVPPFAATVTVPAAASTAATVPFALNATLTRLAG